MALEEKYKGLFAKIGQLLAREYVCISADSPRNLKRQLSFGFL